MCRIAQIHIHTKYNKKSNLIINICLQIDFEFFQYFLCKHNYENIQVVGGSIDQLKNEKISERKINAKNIFNYFKTQPVPPLTSKTVLCSCQQGTWLKLLRKKEEGKSIKEWT